MGAFLSTGDYRTARSSIRMERVDEDADHTDPGPRRWIITVDERDFMQNRIKHDDVMILLSHLQLVLGKNYPDVDAKSFFESRELWDLLFTPLTEEPRRPGFFKRLLGRL
jgi:hypothetical protein